MSKLEMPVTPAVRELRDCKIEFEPLLYKYADRGGAKHAAEELGLSLHAVVKTVIMETDQKSYLAMLMYGDQEISTKQLARILSVKTISPMSPDKANRLTGYLVGGTSPFGLKTKMPIYCEEGIMNLDRIFINGGKRGFLVAIKPEVLKLVLAVQLVKTT